MIQWDITYHEAEETKISFLYLRENNKDVKIADMNVKLNEKGKAFLGDRANVSIEFNRVVVTIHKLKYNDEFVFTCLTKGVTESDKVNKQNKTISINNVKGKFEFIFQLKKKLKCILNLSDLANLVSNFCSLVYSLL